ncbi:MAG TPA: MFS transporter [Noviherbaspirillum sp.]|jgi:MFS family permease|uniref:MFS transporter n=1 Tax=Noviherbaspirillum sp. TaxID=1926288 RepID=UPI002F959C66
MKNDNPPPRLFGNRNFRWLFAGSLVSQLGDQFTLIALPWLVLQLTGDPLVLGTVLAVMGVPRALLILLGGALVDRYSPKQVLMLSKYACVLLLAMLAALTLAGKPDLRIVYALALAIGVASAFSLPSATSILPTVMPPQLLGQATALMSGVRQLALFAGPLLAGVLIAAFGDLATAGAADRAGLAGIGIAFALDAATFALSAWTLSRVTPLVAAVAPPAREAAPVWAAVGEGLRYCWRDNSLRVCFCYWAAVAFFITGPVQVAMPVLASEVGGSASAFGMLAGAFGAGTLIGMAFSALRPGFRLGSLGTTILALDAAVGLLFMPLGLISATWQGVVLLLAVGALGGFLQVVIFTWLQRYVAPAMLGRSMALFMFIFMGIAPISSSVTGWAMRSVGLPVLFLACGATLVAIVLLAFLASGMPAVADVGRTPAT